jgi:beta-lactamase class A
MAMPFLARVPLLLAVAAALACSPPAGTPAGGSGGPRPSRPASPSPSPKAADALAAELARIAPTAGGEVGVSARHVETGESASFHGDQRFPMASVYKLPIAIALLQRVDRGEVTLDQDVVIAPADVRPGHSPLAARAAAGGPAVPVRQLLSLAVAESDNTASDRLLALAGGPEAVRETLAGARITHVDVSRSEGQAFLDYWGVQNAPPPESWSLSLFQRLRAGLTPEQRKSAAERFAADPRDTATPDAMVSLLAALQKGTLLKPESTRLLLDVMARTTTGPNRIRAGVPRRARVAHKTGTGGDYAGINAATNDVALVTLPDGRHVAIAVFVKSSRRPMQEREQAIATLARAAYEYWTSR